MVEDERAVGAAQGHQLADGYHSATGAAHVEPFEVLRRLAELGFRLHDDAEGAAVQVEVVQIETAEIGLQGLKGIRDGDTEDSARSRSKSSHNCGSLAEKVVMTPATSGRCRAASGPVGRLSQARHILSAAILDLHVEAAGLPQALDRRHWLGDYAAPFNGREAGARLLMSDVACSSLSWRSSHGFKTTNSVPKFEAKILLTRLCPVRLK